MGDTNVIMRTIAHVVSWLLLSLLLIFAGAAAAALVVVWPPFGIGVLAAGAGARLLSETHNRHP